MTLCTLACSLCVCVCMFQFDKFPRVTFNASKNALTVQKCMVLCIISVSSVGPQDIPAKTDRWSGQLLSNICQLQTVDLLETTMCASRQIGQGQSWVLQMKGWVQFCHQRCCSPAGDTAADHNPERLGPGITFPHLAHWHCRPVQRFKSLAAEYHDVQQAIDLNATKHAAECALWNCKACLWVSLLGIALGREALSRGWHLRGGVCCIAPLPRRWNALLLGRLQAEFSRLLCFHGFRNPVTHMPAFVCCTWAFHVCALKQCLYEALFGKIS